MYDAAMHCPVLTSCFPLLSMTLLCDVRYRHRGMLLGFRSAMSGANLVSCSYVFSMSSTDMAYASTSSLRDV
eukprot:524111-Rhodomonas_salina.1